MNDLSPLSDLVADDLFLDRLARRTDAGSEPLAGLLGALATYADTPLPARTGRRRMAKKHRYLGAFAALAIAASGAGVAAAVSLPEAGRQPDRGRLAQQMEQSARSNAPSALLSRLGLPQTNGTTTARGLVLARRADGAIVLLPAAVAAAELARRGGTHGGGTTGAAGNRAGGSAQAGTSGNSTGNPSGSSTSNPSGNATDGDGSGAGDQPVDVDEDAPAEAGGSPTGTPQAGGNGKTDPRATKGTAVRPTPRTSPTTDATTPDALVTTNSGSPRTAGPTLPAAGRPGSSTDDSSTATATP